MCLQCKFIFYIKYMNMSSNSSVDLEIPFFADRERQTPRMLMEFKHHKNEASALFHLSRNAVLSLLFFFFLNKLILKPLECVCISGYQLSTAVQVSFQKK